MKLARVTSGNRRWPCGLLGTLAILCAVELRLQRWAWECTPFFTLDWPVTGQAAREKAPGCDVLCFGDSLVKFGVLPRVLQDQLALRAYNLAVCGGQAPSTYFLLRRAIESGARPRAILVDFMPHLLDHGPRHSIRQWPELLNPCEFIELCTQARSGTFFAMTAIAEILPSVRARFELRSALITALEGKPLNSEIAAYQRNWETNQGAHVIAKRPGAESRVYRLERWEDFPRRWSCHRTNAEFLRRLLRLAQQHAIRVYWLLPPVRPDTQQRREAMGVDEPYASFIRRIQQEFPNLCVIDGRHAGYDKALFADPLHLAPAGARVLSLGIAEVLATADESAESDSRWHSLPGMQSESISTGPTAIEHPELAIRLLPRRLGR